MFKMSKLGLVCQTKVAPSITACALRRRLSEIFRLFMSQIHLEWLNDTSNILIVDLNRLVSFDCYTRQSHVLCYGFAGLTRINNSYIYCNIRKLCLIDMGHTHTHAHTEEIYTIQSEYKKYT